MKRKPFGYRKPKFMDDPSIPIVGRTPDRDNERLQVMLGNLLTWVMAEHPGMTPEEWQQILKGEPASESAN